MENTTSVKTQRYAVAAFFFFYGLSFASWASRIPSIQQELNLNDAQLGGVLLALPLGLFISLPFAGWLISKTGSRIVVLISAVLYTSFLLLIGLASSVALLVSVLFLFGFAGNMLNISVNTQAVSVESLYPKPIMASFHGMWSLAGFAGAAIGTIMMAYHVVPLYHFSLIWFVALLSTVISSRYLLKTDINSGEAKPIFSLPDKEIFSLGAIAFCSMMCEGAMFDWSNVYFKKIVMVPPAWVGAGYTAFMITMAGTRFVADWLTHRFGLKKILIGGGLLAATGLLTAVIFPVLPLAILGFLIVGMGTSSVIPLVYSAVGKSKTMSPGVALAAVSTLGFFGLLLGPPVIGFVAGASSLRWSFLIIAGMGLCVSGLSWKLKF
ncbi:MAG: MFS transporter [Mucilaginibacter polytrichastri]|nr:MFS transporter [Mucilaginibacter polytrichastri]